MAYKSGMGGERKAELKMDKTPVQTLKITLILSWTIESEVQWLNARHYNMSSDSCNYFSEDHCSLPANWRIQSSLKN